MATGARRPRRRRALDHLLGRGGALPRRRTTGPSHVLVVVGDAHPAQGQAAVRLAEARGWPVLAEPSSGARSGPNALRLGHLLVGAEGWLTAHLPERVLVVGHPTLHRQVLALLRRSDVRIDVVSSPAGWADATRTAASVLPAVPAQGGHHPPVDPSWLTAWRDADAAAAAAVDQLLAAEPADAPPGPRIAAGLLAALPAGSFLLAGSSMPVRDLASAPPRDGVTVHSSRGTAGIDGSVSTALGSALAWQLAGGGRAFALLGDLTFVHDQNGLLLGPDEPRPDLTIVVVNNDGGAIFSLLEQGSAAFAPGLRAGVRHAARRRPGRRVRCDRGPRTRGSARSTTSSALPSTRAAGLQVIEVRTSRPATASGPAASAQRSRPPSSWSLGGRSSDEVTRLCGARQSDSRASLIGHELGLRLGELRVGVRARDDAAAGEEPGPVAGDLGAAQRDAELAVAVGADPAHRPGVATPVHPLELADQLERLVRSGCRRPPRSGAARPRARGPTTRRRSSR